MKTKMVMLVVLATVLSACSTSGGGKRIPMSSEEKIQEYSRLDAPNS